MYKYEQLRGIHKNRKMNPERAVMQTICKKPEFYLSSIVDVIIFLFPLGVFLFKLINGNNSSSSTNFTVLIVLIFGTPIFYYIFIGFLGGQSIGLRVFGLRYVRIGDQQLMDKEMYFSLTLERMFVGFRYDDTYEAFSTLFSETNQSPVMRKLGLIIVKKRIYKLFLDDYSENGQIIRSNANSSNYLVNNSQIFKD